MMLLHYLWDVHCSVSRLFCAMMKQHIDKDLTIFLLLSGQGAPLVLKENYRNDLSPIGKII